MHCSRIGGTYIAICTGFHLYRLFGGICVVESSRISTKWHRYISTCGMECENRIKHLYVYDYTICYALAVLANMKTLSTNTKWLIVFVNTAFNNAHMYMLLQ